MGLALATMQTACAGSAQVVRRRGDVETSGRSVSPIAYAWFARGLYHERLGHLEQAARDFGAAVAADKKSGTSWAAWGRVLCGLDRNLAFRTFEDGLDRAERTAPILQARARCRLGAPASLQAVKEASPEPGDEAKTAVLLALRDAQEALLLEPKSPASSALLAECFERLGQPTRARRALRGYRLFTGAPPQDAPQNARAAIDDALSQGDLEAAASHALTTMSPGELAARAALLGKRDVAWAQTTFVLRANPDDMDAKVTRFVLEGNSAERTAVVPVPSDVGDWDLRQSSAEGDADLLSPSAVVLFSKYLKRQVGDQAAKHFLRENLALLKQEKDPWLEQLAGEVLEEGPGL